MNDTYVILVNYNGYKDTLSCIESIKNNENNKISIIVVDNNSTDSSIEYLEKIEGIILIKSNENLGFAKGNNLGIKYALENGAKYIMLLNNDTEITSNAITIIKQKLEEDNSLGAVGSRIMYYDNKNIVNYCGGHFNWTRGITVHENYKQEFNKNLGKFFYTEFITGCSVMVKKEVFEKIGLLPEEYFMYFEDADFCVKVAEVGYKLGVCTDSIIYHKVSAASGGEDSAFSIKWMTRNRMIFMKKYKKYTKGILTLIFFYITRILKIIKNLLLNKKQINEAIINGIREGKTYIKNNNL